MQVRIFTDGACSENPGPGGWAAVFNMPTKSFHISGNEDETTNNRMELKAVIEAYKKIICGDETTNFDTFEIYSDSAYVVNAINNGWIETWKKNNWQTTKKEDVKNRDLWEELTELRRKAKLRNFVITINKIKGHSGNTFNELVDKLARNESMIAKERKGWY